MTVTTVNVQVFINDAQIPATSPFLRLAESDSLSIQEQLKNLWFILLRYRTLLKRGIIAGSDIWMQKRGPSASQCWANESLRQRKKQFELLITVIRNSADSMLVFSQVRPKQTLSKMLSNAVQASTFHCPEVFKNAASFWCCVHLYAAKCINYTMCVTVRG